MKIDTITLKNFRCFDEYNISFGTHITVLIGKNGTGKTSLLNAIKKGGSFMFTKTSPLFKKTLGASNGCMVKAFDLWDTRFDSLERVHKFPTQINYKACFNNSELDWSFLKKNHPGKLHSTLYNIALNKVLEHYNTNGNEANLPVLAYFSDSYPHILTNAGVNAKKIISADVLPRDFGYYGWDADTNCNELWQIRYIKCANYITDRDNEIKRTEENIDLFNAKLGSIDTFDKDNKDDWRERLQKLEDRLYIIKNNPNVAKFTEEINFINKKIELFTAPIRDDLNFINDEFGIKSTFVNKPDKTSFFIEYLFANGTSMFFDSLPQGYKRLLSIVLDIAYRSYILNEAIESEGVVMIDEVELHLHPVLQQEVLVRLNKTFPNMQFIVSTHSPLVISNLNADGIENKIIKLENDGINYTNEEVENVYGIDYTTNLINVMDAQYRPSTIDKLINMYLILKGKKKDEDALVILSRLENYIGGDIPFLLQKEIDDKLKAYN
ncbi:MAG: AAA family ATPase [Bacteroidia bacterium]